MKALVWLFVAAGLLAVSGAPGGAAVAGAAKPLATMVVQPRLIARERLIDGVVEAVRETTVSAQTSGRVSQILVDVDDFAAQGDVIVRFEDTQQRASVERAKAALDGAVANGRRARQNFERISKLYKNHTVARARFDVARADNESAKSRIASARAALKQAREQLAYTVVRAPYSGIVKKRYIEVGELASPGKPLISGFSLDELRVRVDAPQALVAFIRAKPQARVFRPAGKGGPVKAIKVTVFPFANPASNTFTVRLYLPLKIRGLLPGMLVTAAFVTGQRNSYIVPDGAVVQRGELNGVYVVGKDGQVQLRQIQPGRRLQGNMIEVLAGLSAGEKLVLDPVRASVMREADNRRGQPGEKK